MMEVLTEEAEMEAPTKVTTPVVEEQMEITEQINPETGAPADSSILEDMSVLSPEESDILEEIRDMDSFRDYTLDLAREMRGFTSDHF